MALIAGGRAAAGWLWLGATLDPDTALYAQGGIGLFPSPLGRLVGTGGETALAVLNVAANVLLVLAVAHGAKLLGGRGWLAAVAFLVAPLSWWAMFVGVDTAAAAAIAAAFVWGRSWSRPLLLVLAVGLHPAALIVVAAYVSLLKPVRALWIVAGGTALALATPYRGLLLDLDALTVASSAIATAGVFVLSLLPVLASRSLGLVVPAILGGSIAAGLVAGAAWETNCRYMLPAVALGCMAIGTLSTRSATS